MKQINSSKPIITKKVKKIISEFLGIEEDDIQNDDFLTDDLHMTPADLSELKQTIEEEEISSTNLDFTKINSVEELIEELDENSIL